MLMLLLLLKKKNYACVDAATGKRTVKGLYIKTEVYDDGTQKSVKVINRR